MQCSRNGISNRRQFKLLPEGELQNMAGQQYRSFLSTAKVLGNSGPVNRDAEMVKRIGNRIAKVVTEYYTSKGLGSELQGFAWEFNLVEDNQVNAWCMPGGKVAVYTGLLPITQNEAALAVVMGHEIAHALLHHGNERMSQQMAFQGIQILGNVALSSNQQTVNLFNTLYGVGAQVGVILPFSRKHELESDRFGLMFAAMAGYNPREAIPLWERMEKAGGGNKPPEFLSTHPSEGRRIDQLNKYMDEALNYYKPINAPK
jgi:predicted Zn-dependent protease